MGNRVKTKTPIPPILFALLPLLSLLMPDVAHSASSTPNPSSPREDAADLVFERGVFYPVEPPTRIEGSLAVKDGRIVFLGSASDGRRWIGPNTEVVDLRGRTVTPGLIDAHSHLAGFGRALSELDLRGLASFDEVVARARAAAAELPKGTWVRGRGWDQNLWPGKTFPEHGALSAAVPDHPVWLERVDGHAALLNAQALATLGLDDSVKDPSGGRFLRDARGRLSGVLVDQAQNWRPAALDGQPDPLATSVPELRAAIRRGALGCLAVGLTTVTDMGVDARDIEAYRELRRAGELPIRAALFLTDNRDLLASWFARGPELDPEARLQIRGVKMYADGALGSRGAALVEPYHDDPTNLGLLTASVDHLTDVSRRALAAGFQVGIHAIGDRGNLVAIDAIERAFGGPRPELRFRIEHAQVMRLDDISRLARLGIIASVQPTHATSDMPWAGDRVGPRRLEGAYAWRKLLDAGGSLALGSDFPVESNDPRLGLYAAISRQDLVGQPAGGWLPGERLTPEEALRGFTLDAARSLFLEREIGSLAIGKRADLAVFARDPFAGEPAEIPRIEVDFTYVDGKLAFRREGVR